jgi:hypothetical protein
VIDVLEENVTHFYIRNVTIRNDLNNCFFKNLTPTLSKGEGERIAKIYDGYYSKTYSADFNLFKINLAHKLLFNVIVCVA